MPLSLVSATAGPAVNNVTTMAMDANRRTYASLNRWRLSRVVLLRSSLGLRRLFFALSERARGGSLGQPELLSCSVRSSLRTLVRPTAEALAREHVAVGDAGGREDELPDLQDFCAEAAGTAQQVVLPQSVE